MRRAERKPNHIFHALLFIFTPMLLMASVTWTSADADEAAPLADPCTGQWDCADAPESGGFGKAVVGTCSHVYSEIRIDQPSSDNDEYFELTGDASAPLDGLTYLVICDGSGCSGVIEAVVVLTDNSLAASGFFVAAEDTFSLGTAKGQK